MFVCVYVCVCESVCVCVFHRWFVIKADCLIRLSSRVVSGCTFSVIVLHQGPEEQLNVSVLLFSSRGGCSLPHAPLSSSLFRCILRYLARGFQGDSPGENKVEMEMEA